MVEKAAFVRGLFLCRSIVKPLGRLNPRSPAITSQKPVYGSLLQEDGFSTANPLLGFARILLLVTALASYNGPHGSLSTTM